MPTLDDKRFQVANQVLLDYDFEGRVEETSPWEWDSESDEVSRGIFLQNLEKPRAAYLKGRMRIVFEPGTARPVEAEATVGGVPFGGIDLSAVVAEFRGTDYFSSVVSVPAASVSETEQEPEEVEVPDMVVHEPEPVAEVPTVVEPEAPSEAEVEAPVEPEIVSEPEIVAEPVVETAPVVEPEPERAVEAAAPESDEDPMTSKRRTVAETIFEGFDFGRQVSDASGWEWSTPGDEISRTVFLEDASSPGASSIAGILTVRFENDGARPIETYAVVGDDLVEGFDPAKAVETLEGRDPYFFDASSAPRL